MVDLVELLAFGVVGFLSGSLVAILALGVIQKEQILEGIIENFINDLANNEELQKNLYTVGGIIGQGAKAGIGLNLPAPAKGGRFSWQNVLVEIASNFFTKASSNPSPSPGPSPSPQPVTETSKKW